MSTYLKKDTALNGSSNGVNGSSNGHNGVTTKTSHTNGSSNSNPSPPPPPPYYKPMDLKGYVGFDKIADQYVNRSARDGFAFNILCIGN